MLRLAHPLNTGTWQYVGIELVMGQVRVRVNSQKFVLDAEGDVVISEEVREMADDLLIGGSVT